MLQGVDPHWLAALRAGADVPPLRNRVRLQVGAALIGSVEAGVLNRIETLRLPDGKPVLTGSNWGQAAQVQGEPTASLALVAAALRDAGLAHAWRDEQLAVPDAQGRRVATVERAVVRVLGVTTQAVHLVGVAPDGRVWVQQRSLDKANDPGLWDTLMGGMVSAADSVETALVRETWEEAGLVTSGLLHVARGGRVTTRRPSDDSGGAGYVIEHIDWYRAVVPDGMVPVNQDGEVQQFELLDRAALLERLHGNAFTQEAALILCEAL
jgi:8-oxo-dGTP pyrophosphatase MutT (NUDIX family)